jgi:tetratricopeptide (TPR) repeat protein
VAQLTPELPLEPRISRLLESFSVEPTDEIAFRTLEGHLSGAEDWCRLAGVYECRLSTLDADHPERGELLLRLARLLDEDLEDLPGARRCYEEALREAPHRPEWLARLRRLHLRDGDVESALEVASIEDGLERPKGERALWLVEIASIWRARDEAGEAWKRVREALKLDPGCGPAVELLAELAQAAGRTEESVRLLERRAEGLEGSARAEMLERVLELLPPDEEHRVLPLLREIVVLNPDRVTALRRLLPLEEAEAEWARVDWIWRQLWRLLPDQSERSELAFRAAEIHLDTTKDLETAELWSDRALELAPESPTVHGVRARLFRATGRTPALIQSLEFLAANTTFAPEGCLELARLHEGEGNSHRSVEWLRAYLARSPGDEEAWLFLDRCLATLDRPFDRAEVLEKRIGFARDSTKRARLLVAVVGLRVGPLADPEAAEQAYRRALREDPRDPEAATGLESLLRSQGRGEDLARALQELAEGSGHAPSGAHSWGRLGAVRLELLEDPRGAADAFRRSLDLGPGGPEALSGLREVARVVGDPSLRLEACERELAAEPEKTRAGVALEDGVEAALEAGDPIRACRLAAHWVDLIPGVDSLRALARAARESRDRSEEIRALVSLDPLLKEEPEQQGECLVRLGELELESPNPEALRLAATWFEEALGLSPSPDVRRRLAEIYRRLGLLPEVVRVLRQGLDELPPSEANVCRLELAGALEQLRDPEGAAEVLREAWEVAPETPGVARALESLFADLDRVEDLTQLLGQRLERESDPDRRRSIAVRGAELLLDGLGRPGESASMLRPHARPDRSGPAEALFTRALEAGGSIPELERWLGARAREIEGPERERILLRLATVQEQSGRIDEAIASLWRAERAAGRGRRNPIRQRLMALLGSYGGPGDQLDLLGRLLDEAEEGEARLTLRLERARLLSEVGRQVEARVELESARTDGPLPVATLATLAELYGREGRATDQLRILSEILRREPEPSRHRIAALETAAILSTGPDHVRDTDRAEQLLRDLLSDDAEDPEPFRRLASLLEDGARFDALKGLLLDRLSVGNLEREERLSIGLQLARLESPADASCRLRALREELSQNTALDRALADALRASGDTSSELTLSRGPGEPALLHAQISALRETGSEIELAAAIEGALENPDVFSGPDRRRSVRDLVVLRERNLGDPLGALELLERELPDDPTLATLAVRLVSQVNDPDREEQLLKTLVLEPPADFRPRPEHIRRVALALWREGRVEEAEPLLRRSISARPQDLSVVRALETLARTRGDRPERLRWLGARYLLEPRRRRHAIASDAFALAETLGEEGESLSWLRRWQSIEPLSEALCFRWMELEREHGDRAGEIRALRLALRQIENPRVRTRLLARQAERLQESGELELARKAWRNAVQTDPDPDPDLLRAWERLLHDPDHVRERTEALAQLAHHPVLAEEERIHYASTRAELLARVPERRELAVAELRRLLDETPESTPEQRSDWGQQLMTLYAAMGRDREWCDIAEQVAPLLPEEERIDLARELAQKLGGPLGARDRAIVWWEQIVEISPDEEALRSLVELLRAPGYEARRAAILERLAETDPPDAAPLLVEAARARWTILGDARTARTDLNTALALKSDLLDAHELRLQVCAYLDQPDEEAESLQALLDDEAAGPEVADRWLRIAQLFCRREDRRPDARRAAERALALAPENIGMRRSVRKVLERAREWDRVAELLQEEAAQAGAAELPSILRRLARIECRERRDATRGCEVFDQLSRTDPLNVEDLELYAESLAALGRWREAVTVRTRALELRDTSLPEEWLEVARAHLERLDDPAAARATCLTALHCDPDSIDALRLLADIEARLGNATEEILHREVLADRLSDPPEASAELARAATVARESLGNLPQSAGLFRRALRRDPDCPPALLGVGELAMEGREWEEAEQCFGRAYPLLAGTPLRHRRGEAAGLAAQAALELGRDPEALTHLEVALEENPDDPETLDLGATVALRVGAWKKAEQLLEARLTQGEADPRRHAKLLCRLARARGALGDHDAAAEALEQAVFVHPDDELARARLVDLLVELGRTDAAVQQLDAWIPHAPPDAQSELALRAARLELRHGDRARARERLDGIVAEYPGEAGAWREVASLALEEEGPEAALARTAQALGHVAPPPDRAPLLALQASALSALGRGSEAAQSALAAVESDPGDSAGARCLATHIGQARDWARAVRGLERTLVVAHLAPSVEAELWAAVGRAYAGPLQDLRSAERSYRRALAANPENDRAREALADGTSFEPSGHLESLRLHRQLLERFPARSASWRAMERISEHRQHEDLRGACRWVLCVLDGKGESEEATLETRALLCSLRPTPEVEAVVALVRQAELLDEPVPHGSTPAIAVSGPVQDALASLAGPAWDLPDAALPGWIARTLARTRDSDPEVRRRTRAALGEVRASALRKLDARTWRSELLGVAAGHAAGRGPVPPRELFEALLRAWPETVGLEPQAAGNLGEASQLCPPIRRLLLRIADGVLSGLSGG